MMTVSPPSAPSSTAEEVRATSEADISFMTSEQFGVALRRSARATRLHIARSPWAGMQDADVDDAGVENQEWVELRVHGVSGTPPESMLDIDRVVQVGGDELGRTFCRADRLGRKLEVEDGHILEAYHWGALTSGSRTQGLWLLLAPFGLVNVAQFTLQRPTSRPARWAHAVAGAALRLIGLSLTVLFVLAAMVIAVDLWAWQRAQATSALTYLLAFCAPLALLGLYWTLARAKPDPDVAPRPVMIPATPSSGVPGWAGGSVSELVRPTFFESDADAPGLRRLHLAAGGLAVAIMAVCPEAVRTGGFAAIVFWAAFALIGVVGLVVLLLGDPSSQQRWDSGRPDPSARRWVRRRAITKVLAGLAVVALGSAAAITIASPPDPGSAAPGAEVLRHYPGIDWASYVVMAFALVGIVLLVLANMTLAICERSSPVHANRRFAPYLGGMATTCLASIGVFLGVGYVGAFSTAAAAALRSVRPEAPGPPVLVTVPELLSRVIYAWGLTAIVIAALAAVALGLRRCRRSDLVARVEADVSTGTGSERRYALPVRWIRRTADARWLGRLKNVTPVVAALLTVVGLALSTAVVAEVLPIVLVDPTGWPRLNPLPSDAAGWLSQSDKWPEGDNAIRSMLLTLGTLTLSTVATALLTLGRSALGGEAARRGVNVVWDVIAFWPRSTHPFVPTTYAQRAVVDIEDRVRWHVEQGRAVALCAHSQGSLLSFAALQRIAHQEGGDRVLDRVGFLTFGSQLQVLFSRTFSSYVNLLAIEQLNRTLHGAWRNLYRDTDPLAGPVLSWGHRAAEPSWVPPVVPWAPLRRHTAGAREEFGPEWRLHDPPVLPGDPPVPAGPLGPDLCAHHLLPLRGHSGYWLDEAWGQALQAVRRDVDSDASDHDPPGGAGGVS